MTSPFSYNFQWYYCCHQGPQNVGWGLDTNVFRDEWVLRRSIYDVSYNLAMPVDIFRYGNSSGGRSVVEIDDEMISTALESIVDIAAQIECDLSPTHMPLLLTSGYALLEPTPPLYGISSLGLAYIV
ncbi:hypothetical protein H109_05818 [Trichophyton interdigitale MR816]|uniref:Uncharacterized protein n=1 Tax=Trichophyton interdigitale (strain MR816) TaxID=1215338 RepID=A0A059J324_TRIIM|nr:hypothetical protein H109_05818 [Trichophyton interdigitale MR816]